MTKSKYLIMMAVNYSLVLLSLILYRGGGFLMLAFSIMQLLIVICNYRVATGKKSLLILNTNLLISTILANYFTTKLYYLNISSDVETLLVGDFALMVGAVYVFVISLISLLLKIRMNVKSI